MNGFLVLLDDFLDFLFFGCSLIILEVVGSGSVDFLSAISEISFSISFSIDALRKAML